MALMIRLFLLATLLCIAYSTQDVFSGAVLHCFMEENPTCQCNMNAYSNFDNLENLGYNTTQLNKARNWFSNYLKLKKEKNLKTRKGRTVCRKQCRKVYDCFYEPLSLEIGHDIPSVRRIVKLLQRYIELQTPKRILLTHTTDHVSLLHRILRSEGYETNVTETWDFYESVTFDLNEGYYTGDIEKNITSQFNFTNNNNNNVKIPFRCQKTAKDCPGFLGNCSDQQYDTDDTCQTACNRTQYAEGKILNNFELALCKIKMEGCNDNKKVCVCGLSFNKCFKSGLPRPTITATAIAKISRFGRFLQTVTCNVAGNHQNSVIWYEIRLFHPELYKEPKGSIYWRTNINKSVTSIGGIDDKKYFRCRARKFLLDTYTWRSWSEWSGNGRVTVLDN